MSEGVYIHSPAALKVIEAFETARSEGRADRQAFEAAVAATPGGTWQRHSVANLLFNYLGKPAWNDVATQDLLGGERQRCTVFAFTDEGMQTAFIGITARRLGRRVSHLLSKARQYNWTGMCGDGPCEWISSVWAGGRSIVVWSLEEVDVIIPHFSRQRRRFYIRENGVMGPQPQFVWSYVAHRAGYTFAHQFWYEKFIPEEDITRDDMRAFISARTWPKRPFRVVTE